MNNFTAEEKILELEKMAMHAWLNGNPTPFLDLYSGDFTYFDPSLELRLDGWDKIKELYEAMRGKSKVDKFDIINPVVQIDGSIAVLSYNLHIFLGEQVWKENCTEVYRMDKSGSWKIIHSHFSPTKPSLK